MHLLRLLLTGAATLREGRVPVRVESHRDRLLAVKRGELSWAEVPGAPSRLSSAAGHQPEADQCRKERLGGEGISSRGARS